MFGMFGQLSKNTVHVLEGVKTQTGTVDVLADGAKALAKIAESKVLRSMATILSHAHTDFGLAREQMPAVASTLRGRGTNVIGLKSAARSSMPGPGPGSGSDSGSAIGLTAAAMLSPRYSGRVAGPGNSIRRT